jgi:NarL family two-component system response regulator YdfI
VEEAPIRVVIADDHPVVRTGLRLMLGTAHDIELVGEATDGREAIRVVQEVEPQVVLMDLRMPDMDGLEAIDSIHARWPDVAIVILTTFNEDELMLKGLQAGARGYLLKDSGLEHILTAVRTAARGEMMVRPETMARILSFAAQSAESSSNAARARSSKVSLTERELEVLAGVAQGERSKEIAMRLNITPRTVEAYLTNIYTKLQVDSRAAAVATAMELGLLHRQ